MKCALVVLAILGCVYAHPQKDTRMVGGINADLRNRYYQASILLDGLHLCSGVILSPYSVLSAAHCFQLDSHALRQYLVKVGSVYIDQGIIYPIFAVKIHERFVNYEYDLAMVTLRVPMIFDAFTNAVVLERTDAFLPGQIGVGSGWSMQAVNSNYLQEAQMKEIQQQLCRQLYSTVTPITDNMVCAGEIAGGVGACSGSFGGPLVLDNKLVGIASFASGCAQIGYPTVYTKTFGLLSWIDAAANIRPPVTFNKTHA